MHRLALKENQKQMKNVKKILKRKRASLQRIFLQKCYFDSRKSSLNSVEQVDYPQAGKFWELR